MVVPGLVCREQNRVDSNNPDSVICFFKTNLRHKSFAGIVSCFVLAYKISHRMENNFSWNIVRVGIKLPVLCHMRMVHPDYVRPCVQKSFIPSGLRASYVEHILRVRAVYAQNKKVGRVFLSQLFDFFDKAVSRTGAWRNIVNH